MKDEPIRVFCSRCGKEWHPSIHYCPKCGILLTREYEQNKENNYIPRLWATRKIGYLTGQIRLNGEKKELVDEIISLSKQFGIMTSYTSFLILENEEDYETGETKSLFPRDEDSPTLTKNELEYLARRDEILGEVDELEMIKSNGEEEE